MSEMTGTKVATFDPVEIIGSQFIQEDDYGVPVRMTVAQHDQDIGKFKLNTPDEEDDEWVDQNVIQEALLSCNDDGAHKWTISKVLDHRTDDNKKTEVKVLWHNGDKSWEPMDVVRKDDPIVLASYAKEKDLIYKPGGRWRWARKLAQNE